MVAPKALSPTPLARVRQRSRAALLVALGLRLVVAVAAFAVLGGLVGSALWEPGRPVDAVPVGDACSDPPCPPEGLPGLRDLPLLVGPLGYLLAALLGVSALLSSLRSAGRWRRGRRGLLPVLGPVAVLIAMEVVPHLVNPCLVAGGLGDDLPSGCSRTTAHGVDVHEHWDALHHAVVGGLPARCLDDQGGRDPPHRLPASSPVRDRTTAVRGRVARCPRDAQPCRHCHPHRRVGGRFSRPARRGVARVRRGIDISGRRLPATGLCRLPVHSRQLDPARSSGAAPNRSPCAGAQAPPPARPAHGPPRRRRRSPRSPPRTPARGAPRGAGTRVDRPRSLDVEERGCVGPPGVRTTPGAGHRRTPDVVPAAEQRNDQGAAALVCRGSRA